MRLPWGRHPGVWPYAASCDLSNPSRVLQWAEGGGSNGKWIANATQMAASNSYGLTWCAWGSGWCMKRDSYDVEFGALDLWRRTSIEAGQPDGKTRLKGQGGGYNGVLDANIFQLRYRETPPTTKAGMLEISSPGPPWPLRPVGKSASFQLVSPTATPALRR